MTGSSNQTGGPLIECAREFAEVRGEIARVRNGHNDQARALSKLTGVIEAAEMRSRVNHDETLSAVTGFQSTITGLCAVQSERTALVEVSAKSAHHRLDGQTKMLWAIILLLIGSAVGIIVRLFAVGLPGG